MRSAPVKTTPLVATGLLALAILAVGLGLWGTQTRIATAIIAPGVLDRDPPSQTVAHPLGGVVHRLWIRDGAQVEKGAPLITLDGQDLQADLGQVSAELDELRARQARLIAERDGLIEINFPIDLIERAQTNADVGDILAGQRAVFTARHNAISTEAARTRAQQDQIKNKIKGLEAQLAANREQAILIRADLKSAQHLHDQGLAPAARLNTLKRDQAQSRARNGALIAEIAQNHARIAEIDVALSRLDYTQLETTISQLRDVALQIRTKSERQNALRHRAEAMIIRAPLAGKITQYAHAGPGSVLRAAEPVLRVVPRDGVFIIRAQIKPQDVDAIRVGHPARVRVTTSGHGSAADLSARVAVVSAAAAYAPDTHQPYYTATLTLDQTQLDGIESHSLRPGLPVEVFFTGPEQTPLSYLLDPFLRYFDKALREPAL